MKVARVIALSLCIGSLLQVQSAMAAERGGFFNRFFGAFSWVKRSSSNPVAAPQQASNGFQDVSDDEQFDDGGGGYDEVFAQQELDRVIRNVFAGKADRYSLYSKVLNNNLQGRISINSFLPSDQSGNLVPLNFEDEDDVNFQINPFLAAIFTKNESAVRNLFSFYRDTLDVNAKTPSDETKKLPFHYAVTYAPEIVDSLLEIPTIQVNSIIPGHKTPLSKAAEKGRRDIVDKLFNGGFIDLNMMPLDDRELQNRIEAAKDSAAQNPVRACVDSIVSPFKRKNVPFFLGKIQNPNEFVRCVHILSKNKNYTLNPLSAAVFSGEENHLVAALLSGGKTITIPMAQGRPAQVVLQQPIDVDAVHPLDGMTPLHWAVIGNNAKGATMLVEARANWTLRNSDGRTALMLAKKMKHEEVAGIIPETF